MWSGVGTPPVLTDNMQEKNQKSEKCGALVNLWALFRGKVLLWLCVKAGLSTCIGVSQLVSMEILDASIRVEPELFPGNN